MKHLKALVLMQLQDKLDFSFLNTRKTLIRKIVFTLLKFVGVGAAAFLIRYLLGFIIFQNSDTPQIMIVVLTFLLGISVITCTVGLVKSLYFADDNRVLITFPVGNNIIFISKLIVYYFYELIKEYTLVLPIMLGIGIHYIANLTFVFIPWTMIMMVIIPALPVLLGALLSIPALYLARFANRYTLIKIVLFIIGVGLCVWGIVALIGLLPENIDLANQGPALIGAIREFLLGFRRAVLPVTLIVELFIGQQQKNDIFTIFSGKTFVILAGLIVIVALLVAIVYVVSRPLFFKMMSKSFEFEKKSVEKERMNKQRSKWQAFTLKEFKLCVMNTEVSLNFIAVYVAVPIMILLLNKLYAAMDTRLKGQVMTYAFNLLIMLLPMLASNSVIATLFSKEGRAGYMKKTEPINILMPLIAKFIFFMLLSIPSIIATVVVFGSFVSAMFKWYDLIMLAFMLLFLQYGHMFLSALFDIMNPQNEQYATVGSSAQNPNEGKSTMVAFAISGVFALFGFILFQESALSSNTVTMAMIKLFLVAGAFCVAMVSLFVKSVKTYYYEK